MKKTRDNKLADTATLLWGLALFSVALFSVALCSVAHVNAGEPVTFGVLGDYGGGQEVAEIVRLIQPDYLVSVGDNNYGNVEVGSPDWESQVGDLYGDYILGRADGRYSSQVSETERFFPAVGNHDVQSATSLSGNREGYLDYFHANPYGSEEIAGRLPQGFHSTDASYYDIRLGDVHLFSLDSQAIVAGVHAEEQRAWLEAATLGSDAQWKFAFFHHPAYSSSQHGSHSAMQWSFGDYGIDAVFSGHDHVYERIVEDTNYFVAGTGGGSGLYSFRDEVDGSVFQYNEKYGAVFFTVLEDTTTVLFLNVDSEIVDQVELVKELPEPECSVLLLVGWLGALRLCVTRRQTGLSN